MVEFQTNPFKRALREGRLQIGLWSSLCSNIAAEIISDSGFDWILLDTEHSPNEIPDLVTQLQAVQRGTATPIIRPAWNDAVLAKRALDLSLTDEPGATNSASMIARASRLHPDAAFDFAVAHRTQVDARVDSTSRSRYYPGLANNSLDQAMIAKLKAFADSYIAATSRRATDTAIANIVYRRQVHDARLPAIDAWLKAQTKR